MFEDTLARLAEELEREIDGNRTVAVDDLAARFGVESKDVRACLAALQAMDSALGEDLPAVPALPPDYEMLGEIGRGGMGIVYRARQRSLDRVVAVKVLRPGDLLFGEMLRRFQKEAQTLARLRHRHIVSIHEVGESGGNVYYTMDCIEGSSLAGLLERREITPARAVRIVRQVASAVAYVHSNGLIHRDLKPSNILIDAAGDAYVVDFGLARDAAKNDLTATGHVLGTPAYMSPEQARGDGPRIGEATDIYSLGAILYECLAGKPPFVRSSLADLLHDVIHREPASPRSLNPQAPHDLEVICLKAMAKEPERRYATMRAMLEDLERFEGGRPILARGPGLGYRAWRFTARNSRSGVSIAATLAISTMLWVWLPTQIGERRESMSTVADELHRCGDHGGAAVMYRKALAPDREAGSDRQVVQALVRCRFEWAREIGTRQNLEEVRKAADVIHQTLNEFGPELRATTCPWSEMVSTLVWELTLRWGQMGNADEAIRAFEGLRSKLEKFNIVSREWESSGELAGRILAESGESNRITAARIVAGLVTCNRKNVLIFGWGTRAPGILVKLLASLSDLESEKRDRVGVLLRNWIPPLAGRGEREALAALAEDQALPLPTRRLALACLVSAADLPIQPPDSHAPDTFAPYATQVLSAWREVKDLTRLDGYRRRIDLALEQKDNWIFTQIWLNQHLGNAGAPRNFDAFQERWRSQRSEDPRLRLLELLPLNKMPIASDLPSLCRRFLRSSGHERQLWHNLLQLTAPEELSVPTCTYEDQDMLDMAWYRAIQPDRNRSPWVLRLAHMALERGEPELRWEVVREIRVGEPLTIDQALPDPESIRIEDTDLPRLPGMARMLVTRSDSVPHLRASALLFWDKGEPVADIALDALDCGGGGFPAGSLPFCTVPAGKVVASSGEIRCRPSHHPCLTWALVSEPGSEMRPWTVTEWRQALARNVAEAAEKKQANIEILKNQLRAARYLSIPEASSSLVQLAAPAPARLLAGDTGAFDETVSSEGEKNNGWSKHDWAAFWLRAGRVGVDSKLRARIDARLAATGVPDDRGRRVYTIFATCLLTLASGLFLLSLRRRDPRTRLSGLWFVIGLSSAVLCLTPVWTSGRGRWLSCLGMVGSPLLIAVSLCFFSRRCDGYAAWIAPGLWFLAATAGAASAVAPRHLTPYAVADMSVVLGAASFPLLAGLVGRWQGFMRFFPPMAMMVLLVIPAVVGLRDSYFLGKLPPDWYFGSFMTGSVLAYMALLLGAASVSSPTQSRKAAPAAAAISTS